MSFFSRLRRVPGLFRAAWLDSGETTDTTRLDPAELKHAYRHLIFAKPVVDIAASFVLAGGIEVDCEDEEAAAVCEGFHKRNLSELQQGAIESCLYGYTYLLPFWDQDEGRMAKGEGRSRLRVFSPSAVTFVPDPDRPWVAKQVILAVTFDNRRVVQTIDATEWKIEVQGRVTQQGANPYGIIPLVQVQLNRFSDDLYGTGEIDAALHGSLKDYEELGRKGVKNEKRQNSVLILSGVKSFDVLKPKLEGMSSEGVPGIHLPDPKATAKFLESARGPEGIIENLKRLYHAIVVQSQTPEYLFGVGMPSAQASTVEQRAVIERKTTRLRAAWSGALEQVNRIVLTLHEVHETRTFSTDVTTVSFGPMFEKDEAAAADTLQKKSDALVKLNTLGILSRETAQEAIPEIISDVKREADRLAAEKAAVEPYPNPPATGPGAQPPPPAEPPPVPEVP